MSAHSVTVDGVIEDVRTGRVKPLPADQRRAAIIEATLPLLRAHGRSVTTRQIATAAGVAEGTIFRVFPDKHALIEAALATVFDAEPLRCELRDVDRNAPLRDRVAAVVTILSERVRIVWQLLAALESTTREAHSARPRMIPKNQAMAAAMGDLVALFEPDRELLAFPPATTARMVRAVVFAGVHPIISAGKPLSTEEIVTLLLNGIQKSPLESRC